MDFSSYVAYHASKVVSPKHNSILEMLDTRYKLEKLKPGMTFSKKDYNQKVSMDCSAFYSQSGTEYLKVISVNDEKQKLYLDIDFPKFDHAMDDPDFDGFSSIDQAISIVALGNLHEVLKSEYYVRELLHKNKYIKKQSMMSASDFDKQKEYAIVKKFKQFEDKLDFIFKNAHTYMRQDYLMEK